MKAYLILEDGSVFCGKSVGANKEVISEFVFNTSMSGYVEILSDPSYSGQSVIMTYPLIGNYGVCLDDQESKGAKVEGFVVSKLEKKGSNFRKNIDLQEYLLQNDIVAIEGIDTRHVTRIIRDHGCMNGMITTKEYPDTSEVMKKIKEFKVTNVVEKVTCDTITTKGSGKYHVGLYDFGAKQNIINSLLSRDCKVTIFPASTTAKEVLKYNIDGIMLSNGPGNPEECTAIINEIKEIIESNMPIFAICLGHQLMALAHGFKTEKLKYGHHGANHPVQDVLTKKSYITTQNHNYVICGESIDMNVAIPWFVNVNDGTIEGMQYINSNCKTVQFHPEACAGPEDTSYLFDEFIKMMEESTYAKK